MTAKLGTVVTCICFIIGMFFPRVAVGIFTHDEALMEMASHGLRILVLGFPIVGFQMIGTNFFQCLGMVKKSVILSLSRQILFLLPLLYLLPLKWGETGVWLRYPISDVMSCVLAFTMLGTLFKKFGKMNDGDSPADLGIKF
jgi:Na+-driven multidrug efflux pump